MRRTLALIALAGARRLRQRRHRSDRRGGGGGARRILAGRRGRAGGRRAGPAADPRRDHRADVAAIWARLEADPAPTLMYAAAHNGGYVTYFSQLPADGDAARARRSPAPAGSAPTCCRPGAAGRIRWRGRSRREAGRRGCSAATSSRPTAPQGRIETFECRFELGDAARDDDPRRYATAGSRSARTAAGRAGRFENLHFADAATGFVWRSLQWIGPTMGLLDLQIIEPYTGG